MTVRRALWLGLAALIILVSARDAGAGPPTDQLKGAIDRVVATLDSPALKGEGKVLDRRTAVRKIANEIFEIADRVAMLHDGVIVEAGDAASLQASPNPIVQQFIHGEVEGTHHAA